MSRRSSSSSSSQAGGSPPPGSKAKAKAMAVGGNGRRKHYDYHHQEEECLYGCSAEIRSRFEAYSRLQASAVALGLNENDSLAIPEIVALGGQSDGKSTLLEALLGFRFNVREVEMGTRRPLMLQMLHDPSASEPRCRFQDEDSDDYGTPVAAGSSIADIIRTRTEEHLKKLRAAVSAKPIVMRVEYAYCPNLTIIDTPGFVLKAKKGEPDSTPDDILSMVKALASPRHRLLLFLQQSSVEWCSSLWLDTIRSIDPHLRRTIVVVSKFDNRLKEFGERWEVDRYLSASGYLGDNTRPFFVALPKDRGTITNEEFRRQISQVDSEVLRHLRENVVGGFDEEQFGCHIGFLSLKRYLETELERRYWEAAPATLALLEQRVSEVTSEISNIEQKLQSSSDIAALRRSALTYTAAIAGHVVALIDGAADPDPEDWGKTTEDERAESGVGKWPGLNVDVKPVNANLKLYGGAAFARVLQEFNCATCSIECPPLSREMVANILLAHSGRGCYGGGGGGVREVVSAAAAGIAREAARAWLAPLLDAACHRLAFVLTSLFDLATERNKMQDLSDHGDKYNEAGVGGYIVFRTALRRAYNEFVRNLTKKCKELVRHHLDSVTSPYSQVYGLDKARDELLLGVGPSMVASSSVFLDLSQEQQDIPDDDDDGEKQQQQQKENMPSSRQSHTTPNKDSHDQHTKNSCNSFSRDPLKENQMTVPETPSPELPNGNLVAKKNNSTMFSSSTLVAPELVAGGRKRHISSANVGQMHNTKETKHTKSQGLFGDSTHSSTYNEVCCYAAQHFGRIREALHNIVPSTLNAGFLTPCQDKLLLALGIDLFAVDDEKLMEMFVAPDAVDRLRAQHHSLKKRQETLHSCLNEFRNLACLR